MQREKISDVTRVLQSVLLAETSAISIYTAQVYWRGPGVQETFAKILAEEVEHQNNFTDLVNPNLVYNLQLLSQKVGGWALGSALSALPRPMVYWLHVLAEMQAANVYRTAFHNIPKDMKDLRRTLMQAARGEIAHARRFQSLLKNSRNTSVS